MCRGFSLGQDKDRVEHLREPLQHGVLEDPPGLGLVLQAPQALGPHCQAQGALLHMVGLYLEIITAEYHQVWDPMASDRGDRSRIFRVPWHTWRGRPAVLEGAWEVLGVAWA